MSRWNYGRQRDANNPGRFNQLIALQGSTEAQGDGGDGQPSWTATGEIEVRGYWNQTARTQEIIAQSRWNGATGRWEIPWVPGVTDQHRVRFGDRYYRIINVHDPEERHRELHIYCVEDEGAKGAGE